MGIVAGLLGLAYAFWVWRKMRALRLESDRRYQEGGDASIHAFEQEFFEDYKVGLRGSNREHWQQVLAMLVTTLVLSLITWLAYRYGQPGTALTILGAVGGGIGACLFACFTVLGTIVTLFQMLTSRLRQR